MSYPADPGYTNDTTSYAAARSMDSVAGTLRAEALQIIRRSAGLTADEVAALMDMSVLAIRPRLTELKAAGLVYDSGIRRPNISGRQAAVMVPYRSSLETAIDDLIDTIGELT